VLNLFPPILIGLSLYFIFKEDEKAENQTNNKMTNLHNNFLAFERNISVSSSRQQKLRQSRLALENRIREYFRQKSNVLIPRFYIQGSYKMKTMILDNSKTYDVDLGVYFLQEPNVTPKTLQQWVANATSGHTSAGIQHKDKCIRVIYQGDFHIDLPVYYFQPNYDRHPYLATKNGWMLSDPKELCDWFAQKKDAGGQMIRLVKYFKAWAKKRTKKMPSGIALTVLVANNYKADGRDDRAFIQTARAIYNSLSWSIKCKNPASPNDDLLDRLDYAQKQNFEKALNILISEGEKALYSYSVQTAINIWRQQLGNRF
jgi:hypothetical protein